METTSSSRNTAILLLLLAALAVAMLVLANVQLGIHSGLRHGPEAAASVSAMFNPSDGTCNKGPSVEMRSRHGTWMNLCFVDNGVAAWFTTARMTDPSAREITAIPREQISKPAQYFRSVIARDGYKPGDFIYHGDPPQWFTDLIQELIRSGIILQ